MNQPYQGQQRVIIENVEPCIDHGKYPVKRVVGDTMEVTADIFCDGHDVLSAELLYMHKSNPDWKIIEMKHGVNDVWKGTFKVAQQGNYTYTIRAWADKFKTWHHDILKKIDADVELKSDIAVGVQLISLVLEIYPQITPTDKEYLESVIQLFDSDQQDMEKIRPIVSQDLYQVMLKYPVRGHATAYKLELEATAERKKAGFSAWYEFFPRSTAKEPGKHGTFKDAMAHLDYVADLGFDVVYFPPIHPIGEQHRKGKNNAVTAQPGEPGSPWAIGSKEGGHKSIHKELGTLEDFKNLVKRAEELGIEIALDIAYQCSPDHPYVTEHPEWFRHRPDGSIQYAENPPKKYQDIYPFDFETEDWQAMWDELKSIFTYWIDQGVKIFRVDNPHTKSLRFWGWVIDEIHKEHPDIIFLSEAFTRPKVMYQLAKRGFTQSYTYFTWRNTKWEITQYFKELLKPGVKDFFRPNLWPNTPDILPEFLQVAGKPGYLIRAILAATLSSNYGIYGPAFELMESEPKDFGGEEYLNSEKYEIKDWDYSKKGAISTILRKLNTIRKENEALQTNQSLKFLETENDNLIAYTKTTDDHSNIMLTVVNLDPHHTHSGWVHLPAEDFGMAPHDSYQVHDLLGGSYYLWHGPANYVEINPGVIPAHIFKVRRKVRTEQDFDYFM